MNNEQPKHRELLEGLPAVQQIKFMQQLRCKAFGIEAKVAKASDQHQDERQSCLYRATIYSGPYDVLVLRTADSTTSMINIACEAADSVAGRHTPPPVSAPLALFDPDTAWQVNQVSPRISAAATHACRAAASLVPRAEKPDVCSDGERPQQPLGPGTASKIGDSCDVAGACREECDPAGRSWSAPSGRPGNAERCTRRHQARAVLLSQAAVPVSKDEPVDRHEQRSNHRNATEHRDLIDDAAAPLMCADRAIMVPFFVHPRRRSFAKAKFWRPFAEAERVTVDRQETKQEVPALEQLGVDLPIGDREVLPLLRRRQPDEGRQFPVHRREGRFRPEFARSDRQVGSNLE